MVLGALSLAAIPAGLVAARYLQGVGLLEATVAAAPAGLVLGVAALRAARAGRVRAGRSLRAPAERALRLGRLLGAAGTYVGLTGALALGVYLVLRAAS